MMEFVYGVATATEVAYYTYIYAAAIGDKPAYQRLTSLVRASVLVGRFASGMHPTPTSLQSEAHYVNVEFVTLSCEHILLQYDYYYSGLRYLSSTLT